MTSESTHVPGESPDGGAFLNLVRARLSVRSYASRPVERAVIDRCVEAARLAPSACNSQPWQFIIADRDPLRARLAQAAFGGLYSMNAFAKAAPVLVVVTAERSRFVAALGGMLRGVHYNLLDVGIAVEHMILQAAAEGVGSCWLGWFDERAVKKTLTLPRSARVPVVISMGYPAGPRVSAAPRKSLDEIRRYV